MPRFIAALTLHIRTCTAGAAAPPNVVLIVGDDQGWTDYGFMGHAHIRTPHLDKLAAEGLLFNRGYVPSQPVPGEPGDDDHRPVPAPAQDHVERPAASRRG